MTGRTFGVEEEFILADALTGEPVARGPMLVARADDPALATEFKQEQVEIASRVCSTMDELEADLALLRRRVADLAGSLGAVVIASGTWPGVHAPTPTVSERFARIGHEFGQLADHQLTCGTHVHVAIDSPEEGVVVLDRIRAWLPVLTALAANSPYWQGRDTGYASFRSVVLSQLPTAGPTQAWGDVDTYRRASQQVIDAGGAFDKGMLYYDARLSATFPTVEIRVTDVCPEPGIAVAVAALCRALVETAIARATAPVDVSTLALRAAAWRAARHGLTEQLVDPASGQLAPAERVVGSLLAAISDALEANGDLARVRDTIDRLVRDGGFAQRQRRLVDPTSRAGLQAFVVGPPTDRGPTSKRSWANPPARREGERG
ncbi:glutamate--cysteine ligase [Knoellia sp. S7-12]|uniref:carboxylate-amine ligase n=1 Tax=Knoellia sp. S7-12 TaxID=3126698 RepID=UPI0033669676